MGAKLSMTLCDVKNRTTTRSYEMATQVLLADYLTEFATFLAALDAVTDLGSLRGKITLDLDSDTFALVGDANIDTGATFSGFIDGGDGSKASMRIPGIKMALVGDGGAVPLTGAVATFLALFETAGAFTLAKGKTIDTWISGALDK